MKAAPSQPMLCAAAHASMRVATSAKSAAHATLHGSTWFGFGFGFEFELGLGLGLALGLGLE